MGRKAEAELERARYILNKNADLRKARLPKDDLFKSNGPLIMIGLLPQLLVTPPAAIGILTLMAGIGIGDNK